MSTTEGHGRLAALLEMTVRLAEIVEDENERLKRGDYKVLREHQIEKEKLSFRYNEELRLVKSRKNAFDGAPVELRESCKVATKRFEAALVKHRLIAAALHSIGEKLVKTIRDTAVARHQPVTNYGRTGNVMRAPVAAYGGRTLAIAVHQVV